MNDINYTYEVTSVDEAARCMEIVYQADGHQTMHIGARLPFEGETLEDIVSMFAPVAIWVEQATPVVVPTVGVTGTTTAKLTPDVVAPVENLMPVDPVFVVQTL